MKCEKCHKEITGRQWELIDVRNDEIIHLYFCSKEHLYKDLSKNS